MADTGANIACGILDFNSLISAYNTRQQAVQGSVTALASKMSQASPAAFLLVQFGMSQVTQIGESISNLISQVNQVINKSISNQAR